MPPFLKKYFLFILYPDSKIIGGSSRITKIYEKLAVSYCRYVRICNSLKIKPQSAPISTVRPASYKYLCPDFFRNYPAVEATMSIKITIKISVLISLSSCCLSLFVAKL